MGERGLKKGLETVKRIRRRKKSERLNKFGEDLEGEGRVNDDLWW